MTFSVKYKPLFTVKIIHNFFLNKGTSEFAGMSNTDKEKQLLFYNVSNFFTIQPTVLCRQKLDGHRLVFRNSGDEIAVWYKVNESAENEPFIELDDNLNFTFLMKLKDAHFYNYTNLKLDNTGKTYYFSNKRLSTETGTFPLINKSGDNSSIDQDFILSGSGATNELEQLNEIEKRNLFGIIRINMKGENTSFDVSDSQGNVPNSTKTFEILFENRKTTWRYIFNSEQTVVGADDVEVEIGDTKVLITKTEHPLTQKGFVSIELGGVELPNPDSSLIKPNSTNNKIYSEVYM